MSLIDTIVASREFAIRAHGSQKYGEHPYVVHLDEVADLVLFECLQTTFAGESASALALDAVPVAYVHDVLEDTKVTSAEIESKLGKTVAVCANLLADPPGENRRERKALLHARLAKLELPVLIDRIVLVVKACDRLANVRRSASGNPSLLKMYREEAEAFSAAVRRPGLCQRVWKELDSLCPM